MADLTLIPDLHHLMIVTTGDVTDQYHLITGGGTGPGLTLLTTEHGRDHTHLTTGGGIGPGHTRLTTEHVTDHTHLTTGEEIGLIRLITEGETGLTHLKVVTIKGTGRCREA